MPIFWHKSFLGDVPGLFAFFHLNYFLLVLLGCMNALRVLWYVSAFLLNSFIGFNQSINQSINQYIPIAPNDPRATQWVPVYNEITNLVLKHNLDRIH
jgi:hypothetical protein